MSYMFMTPAERIEVIHKSPWKGVFAITGGGAGAIYDLQKWGGSSATILEVTIPYATQSFINYVQGEPDKFCSSEGARALAMASFQRALALEASVDGKNLFGMGVSCALSRGKKEQEREGRQNHAWIAVQTADCTHVQHFELEHADRQVQEDQVSTAIIHILHAMCANEPLGYFEKFRTENTKVDATDATRTLVLGQELNQDVPPESIIFSGSFNPIHAGHQEMASYVGKSLNKPIYFELCVRNAAKPPLDYVDIERRTALINKVKGSSDQVILSGAGTFIEKARQYPKPTFIVGVDTWQRILDPKYYGNSVERRDIALDNLVGLGAKFIIFGRANADGTFVTVDEDDSEGHPLINRIITEAEFRSDLSSTQIRATGAA